jgi:hypothetical protein
MNREVHVRFWERAEVKFLRATRQNKNPPFLSLCQLPPAADIPLHWLWSESFLTHALQQRASLENLVSTAGQWQRNCNAERPGSLHVDVQL